MASTARLVRGVRDGHDAAAVRQLMSERRRLLGELVLSVEGSANGFPAGTGSEPARQGNMHALHAAVAESDRTLEALLECTKV
jgi:hypothetical protein